MLWIAIALMTGAAVLCVVWPLSKPRVSAWLPHDGDLRFYREQMQAIDQDVAAGLVGAGEAAGSRAEIGRRLIAASERDAPVEAEAGRRRRLFMASGAIMLLLPALSLGLYLRVGSPDEGDMPLASRTTLPGTNQLAAAIEKVETHLAADPNDGRGFELLGPIYLQVGRFADAAHAYDQAIRLLGETAMRRAGYGQALMGQADGVVTADARAAFEQAAEDDPKAPEPQFFLGLAASQEGDKARARATWSRLADTAPPGAPWVALVRAKLASLDGAPDPMAGPGSPQGAAIAALPADQQGQAIRGMVDGLAARLAQNGQDKDGWLKLVRAYAVLGDKAKALDALGNARRTLAADRPALSQLDGLAHELGLES